MALTLHRSGVVAAASSALVFLALFGCGSADRPSGVSAPIVDLDTELLATRMGEGDDGVRYHFFFEGSSRTAALDGFEWQLGAAVAVDALAGAPVADAWVRSDEDELELTIAFDAVTGIEERVAATDPMARTLWVRARDVHGRVDPTPSRVTVTARSIAPDVVIDFPDYIPFSSCASASRVQTFGWTATDPDATPGALETRFILFPVGGPSEPCLTAVQFDQTLPIPVDDPRWSEWRIYDSGAPTLDPSRSVTFPEQPVGEAFLFAVQARDASGATTASLQWGLNVRHFRVSEGKFPLLQVREPSIGFDSFVAANGLKSYEVPAGHELEFSWLADATVYLGTVVGYRYGWDLADPNDPLDPGWVGPWGSAVEAPARAFSEGSHNFVVQAMDNSGGVSRATYLLPVLRVPPRSEQRDVLFVMDWPALVDPLREVWAAEWTRQIEELVFGFDPRRDVVDAQIEANRLDLATLLSYRAVVWFSNAGSQTFLHTRFAPQSRTELRYNWVEAYQRSGGNLLLAGPGVGLGSLEDHPIGWLFPIIFDDASGGDLGFGQVGFPDGSILNAGTLRWPYSGWCLASIDIVRPAIGRIFGEQPGDFLRDGQCDQLARAERSADFVNRRAGAGAALRDLRPNADRLASHPSYQLRFEEFYDVNVTSRNVIVSPRDCQLPMFVHRAMRDEGHIANPASCPPPGSVTSVIDGAPIAIESAVYADSKPLLGSHDFLWGFHPLGFEEEGLRAALRWVFLNDWELATAKR